jgi:hypothetical protein
MRGSDLSKLQTMEDERFSLNTWTLQPALSQCQSCTWLDRLSNLDFLAWKPGRERAFPLPSPGHGIEGLLVCRRTAPPLAHPLWSGCEGVTMETVMN